MSKRKIELLAVVTASALSYGAWSLMSDSDVAEIDAESAELMVNHVWIDRLPEHERDMIRFFAPIRHPQGRVGIAGRASQWRQLADLFMWSLERDRLALFFGQEQVRWNASAKAWRCDVDGFELCLELSDDRHRIRLYSRDEWEIDPKATVVAEALVEDAPQIAHIVEQALHEPRPAEADLDGYAEDDVLPLWRSPTSAP
jgi:hypothetical protein